MNRINFQFMPNSRRGAAVILCSLLIATSGYVVSADEANELFVKNCASCHSKDGKAQTPAAKMLGVKDLSLSKLTKEQVVLQIQDGKLDPKASSKMPAFKEKLSGEEIEAIVPVVMGFRSAPAADNKK